MIRAIDFGIYIGENKVWFLKGLSNEDFERFDVYPMAPIPYTDLRRPSEWFDMNTAGDVAVWTSQDGICVGDNNGNVTGWTRDKYVMSPHTEGAAYIRSIDQVKHYINALK